MLFPVHHFGFVVRLLAPQHKNHAIGLFVDSPDDFVAELFPALLLMRI